MSNKAIDKDYLLRQLKNFDDDILSETYISKSATAGLLKNDGTVDQTQYVSNISGKTDKVSNATSGNFAGLDFNGNLTDSGKKASDFLPSNTPIPDAVTANPQGTATGTLTKLGIGSDIYDIQGGGGTDVEGNPSGSVTSGDLTKIKIGSDIYNVPDTTYTSKAASSDGTDVSLVTTGEKYIWDNKQNTASFSGNTLVL